MMIDRDVAKRNLIAIEDYAKANWMPRLKRHDVASVYFAKNHCGLRVYPDRLTYSSGDNTYFFGSREDPKDWYDIYDAPNAYTENLFIHWREVKSEMESKISELEHIRDLIENFEV